MMTEKEIHTFQQVSRARLIAVVTLDDVNSAVPLAEALWAGGVRVLELTLRTSGALTAAAAVRKNLPDMLIGIGTILFPAQVPLALEAGASFGVAPGTNPRVIETAIEQGLPFAPGICTPTDIETALHYDRRYLKFFPAEATGGLRYLEQIAAPFAHLGLRYFPLGGVTAQNLCEYAHHPHIAAVGGSWLAPRDLVAQQAWTTITERCQHAMELLATPPTRPK
jgi:2-dehydro-3-deoxyphosphogluconate aldolase / (4S)-4-hydroxy-2-oxoglutarate aldolase